MHSVGFLLVLLCGLLQESRTRFISLNLNFSATYSDEQPKLTAEMLSTCMKETEISMAELNSFSLRLVNKYDGDPGDNVETTTNNDEHENDYDDGTAPMLSERADESLQCFAHCLYERVGLVKDGMFVEHDFFARLYTVIEHEKRPIKECMNLESKNKCQAAYKMHLCYRRLKTLEAEHRIREILEYGKGNMNDAIVERSDETSYVEHENESDSEKHAKDNEIDAN